MVSKSKMALFGWTGTEFVCLSAAFACFCIDRKDLICTQEGKKLLKLDVKFKKQSSGIQSYVQLLSTEGVTTVRWILEQDRELQMADFIW